MLWLLEGIRAFIGDLIRESPQLQTTGSRPMRGARDPTDPRKPVVRNREVSRNSLENKNIAACPEIRSARARGCRLVGSGRCRGARGQSDPRKPVVRDGEVNRNSSENNQIAVYPEIRSAKARSCRLPGAGRCGAPWTNLIRKSPDFWRAGASLPAENKALNPN